jgi:hypothetical protein
MTIQSNDSPGTNSQIRIPQDIELANDMRRSLAKIFNTLLVKEGTRNQNPVSEPMENETGKND